MMDILVNRLLARFNKIRSYLQERLWIKPAIYCLSAIGVVIACYLTQWWIDLGKLRFIEITTVEKLLSLFASSMLAVATFSVGAMISAYSGAANSATPRAFRLIIADDSSKTALSSFIGAFIFSVVGLVAIRSHAFNDTGVMFLFLLTLWIFFWVIGTFVLWVDKLARLGQIQTSVDKAKSATEAAMQRRLANPYLGGQRVDDPDPTLGIAIESKHIGYIDTIDVPFLQRIAETHHCAITVISSIGHFVGRQTTLATADYVDTTASDREDLSEQINKAFTVDDKRSFAEDPLYGVQVLSEIAGRALSPGINDPGTAINIIHAFVFLFDQWFHPKDLPADDASVSYDRVYIPSISAHALLDNAFSSIARYGASDIDVMRALQEALAIIAKMPNEETRALAIQFAQRSLNYAESSLLLDREKAEVRSRFERLATS